MGFLGSLLKDTIGKGVSDAIGKGVSDAIGSAVKSVVEPKATAFANKVAGEIDEAAQGMAQQTREAQQAMQQAAEQAQQAAQTPGFEDAMATLRRSMESFATEAARNTKVCPMCQTPTTADKKFCPACGAKLPEETLAQAAVCPNCGTQNSLGTKFCQECGAKLPAALAEEQATAAKNAAVLAKWAQAMPQYPAWNCGGTEFDLECGEDYFVFSAVLENDYAAQQAVKAYRELLKSNGFVEAGMSPCVQHLYKKINGVCYHVDTEHCFDSDSNMPFVYFNVAEPYGGFDYVKPAAQQKKSGLLDFLGL